MTAVEQVFSIPELFQSLLLDIDIRTLLLSTGVSQHWQSTIQHSLVLQQKLFFTPIDQDSPTTPEHNPLLKSLFSPLFHPRAALTLPWNWHTISSAEFHSLPWFHDEALLRKEAVLRKEASWRRMYPIQPPSKIAKLRDYSGCGCDYDNEIGSIPSSLLDVHG